MFFFFFKFLNLYAHHPIPYAFPVVLLKKLTAYLIVYHFSESHDHRVCFVSCVAVRRN